MKAVDLARTIARMTPYTINASDDKLEYAVVTLNRLIEDAKAIVSKPAKAPVALTGDYPIEGAARKVAWPSPIIQVTYADGERVRLSFATLPGKPLNLGRGLRVAAAAYEIRKGANGIVAPAVTHWQIEREGQVLAQGNGE